MVIPLLNLTPSGDWKLGGVGWCEENSPLPLPSRVNQYLSKYDPPELLRGVTTSPLSTDVWLLGVLVWEVFNGKFTSITIVFNDKFTSITFVLFSGGYVLEC